MASSLVKVDVQNETETTIYDYPGVTKSRAWKFFGFRKNKEGPPIKLNLDMNNAICRLCKKTYTNKGNTTNLLHHIDHEHRDENNNNVVVSRKQTQPTIQAVFGSSNPGRLSRPKQAEVNDAVLKFIVGKCLPISIVKNRHFIHLTGLLDPRYKVPSQADVVKSLVKKKENVCGKLLVDLKSATDVAITHDGWTSCATESYSAVTVHFVDKWELKSAVLQTKKVEGSHTAEHIAQSLEDVKQEWQLPTPIMVTDNAANEKKAATVLGWIRFGCYGHRINLIVKHSLEIPELARILGKSRKLVTFFHQSTSVNDLLKAKQQLIFTATPSLIGHKLIMDVPTRWNSTLAMLERLAEQTPAIMALVNEPRLSKTANTTIRTMCLTLEEHSVIQDLIQVLKPFEKATVLLCSEKNPTMNKVLPTLAKINRSLDASQDSTSAAVKKVVAKMRDELLSRTKCEDIPLLAAMLSPDTKDLKFLSLAERVEAHALLKKEALLIGESVPSVIKQEKLEPLVELEPALPTLIPDLVDEEMPVAVESVDQVSDEPPHKQAKCSDYDDWFDDIICTGESKQILDHVVELEVNRYLAHERCNEIATEPVSVLQWWSQNSFIYPRLAKLAQKYLAVPASSVPSERVFSLAGIVVDKKRSRLKPSMVDSLIFLKMNMDSYW